MEINLDTGLEGIYNTNRPLDGRPRQSVYQPPSSFSEYEIRELRSSPVNTSKFAQWDELIVLPNTQTSWSVSVRQVGSGKD